MLFGILFIASVLKTTSEMEEKIKHLNTQSKGACRIELASVVGKPKDECKDLKVLYAKTDLDKKKCSLERAIPYGWAIGCLLVCIVYLITCSTTEDKAPKNKPFSKDFTLST